MDQDKKNRDCVRLVFRYDGCSAKSSLPLEQKLVEAFAACGVRVLWGVIPLVVEGDCHDPGRQMLLPLPEEKKAWLREVVARDEVEIALHGYCHQRSSARTPGEFVGLPAEEQHRRLLRGKEELERQLGGRITTFIPPWYGYDRLTLKCLQETGFRCLSAGLGGPFPLRAPIRFLPFCCGPAGLQTVLEAALSLRRLDPIIVVRLHAPDFVEAGLSLEAFAQQVEKWAGIAYIQFCFHRQAAFAGLPPSYFWPYACWRRGSLWFPARMRLLLEDQAFWLRRDLEHAILPLWLNQGFISAHRLLSGRSGRDRAACV